MRVDSVKNNSNKPAFGFISQDAKAVLNNVAVRTILNKQYNINKKEVLLLDRSPLRILLLPQKMRTGVLDEFSGLLVEPRPQSGLPRTYIMPDFSKSKNDEVDYFAFCIKKAVDLVKSFNKYSKQYRSHGESKTQSEQVAEIGDSAKKTLRNWVKAYSEEDEISFERFNAKLLDADFKAKVAEKTAKSFKNKTQNERNKLILQDWENILKEQYIQTVKPDKRVG